MPNHTITNATTSMLDMSPLHDVHGRVLTLKPSESREVDTATFEHDIVQRVMKPGWITEGKPAAKATEPAPTPTPEPAPLPEVQFDGTPEEATKFLEDVAREAAKPELPIETPTSSEQPAGDAPTTKPGKARR